MADSIDRIKRLHEGVMPALAPAVFDGGTRVTGSLMNHAWEAYVPGLEDHVLVAVRAGVGEKHLKMEGKERSYRVHPGLVSVIPRGHDGTYRVTTTQVSNVFLTPARLLACAEQISDGRPTELVCRVSINDPKLYSIMDLLSSEAELGASSSRLFIEQLLDLACTQLLRAHSVFSLPNTSQPCGLAPWQVKRVTAYMQANLAQDIGLQALADLVNLSRFYFCGAFRVATGFTPHEWLTKLRMHEARRLLANHALPITQIAFAVGYQTPSAFSAKFRRLVGITPREFRRRS